MKTIKNFGGLYREYLVSNISWIANDDCSVTVRACLLTAVNLL